NEADEAFSVQITSATGAIIGGGTQTETVTIVDNDAVTFSIDSPVVTELDAGATNNLTFTVTVSGDTEQILTVDFASTDGTARNVGTNQGDYETQTGTTTFDGQANFGARTQSILLVINGDDINEPTEDLRVTLTNPVGNLVSIIGALGFGRIADNDPLEISIASTMVTEGAPNAALSFPVTFNRLSEQVIILNVTPTAGTPDTIEFAGAGPGPDDVGQIPALVTFSELTPSQNLVIPVIDDNINEENETITITLTINGTPDQVSFATGADVATGTINDDDNLLVELTTNVTIREDGMTAPFPVQITDVDTAPALGMTEQMIGVVVNTAQSKNTNPNLNAQGDAAIATDQPNTQNSDYQTTTQNILFQMGTNAVLFNVAIANEMTPVNEGEETFEVMLAADPAVNGGVLPRGVSLGTTQVQGIITDDDFISIVVEDLTQSEANTTFNFNVNLVGFTEQDVMVQLATQLGGPVPATQDDFTAVMNTITFARDPTRTMGATRTIMQPVTVIDDVINEANQTFLLAIVNSNMLPQGISAIPSSGTGTISDDDAITFTLVDNNATANQVDEDVAGGNAQFILRFDPATITTTEQTFMINFRANNGVGAIPATTPEDFVATNMDVTFGGTAGNAVDLGDVTGTVDTALTVGIVNDTINEANEDFSAELRNLQGQTNGVMAGTPVVQTVMIIDNDVFILGLRSAGPVTEASPAIFEVFVDTVATAALPNGATGTRQAFTFDFSTADLATAEAIAAADRDYTARTINGVVVNPTPQFIIFNPNQVLPTNMTLSVSTTADAINEANERFNGMAANLVAQGVFFVGSTPPGTIIASIMSPHSILDDDGIVFEIATNGVINETDATMTVMNALTVTTTGATSTEQTFTVPYMFNPNNSDTAVDPNDFSIASITALSFTGTSATAVTVNTTLPIDIDVVGDDINEMFAESFQIMLGTATGTSFVGISVGANGTATQVINDDDVINFAIVANPASASEGTTARPFELTLAAGTLATSTEQTFNIDFATMDGTASSAGDYTMLTRMFMFTGSTGAAVPISLAARELAAAGASRATVTVSDDTINEANETFSGSITAMTRTPQPSPSGQRHITGAMATATIEDNDDIVIDVTAQAAVSETATSFDFTIANSTAATTDTEQSFFVLFDTQDDVATAGDDFVAITNRQLNFSMGTLSNTVTVTLTPDSPMANMGINEANETFNGFIDSLTANPSFRGVSIGNATAAGTINDDDALDLTVQFGTPVSEADPATNPALPFTIVPTGTVTMTQQTFTVDLTFADGTATIANNDYTAATSTVTIPTNVAINVTDNSVTIVSDEVHELDETVISMIGNVSAGAVGVTASGMATGIIDNDDLVLVRIDAATTATEADADADTTVNIQLIDAADGTTAATSQVNIVVAVGNVAVTPVPGVTDPAEAGDFGLPTTATVTAGASTGTFNVNVVGDNINEANELLRIRIANNAMTPTDVTVDTVVANRTNDFTINDDDDITVMYNAGTDGQTVAEGASANYTYTFAGATSTEQAIDILVDADGTTTATAPGNANNDYVFIDENNVIQNAMQIIISTGPEALANIGRTYQIMAIDDGANNEADETYTLVLTARLGGGAPAGTPVRGLTVQAATSSVSGTITD
ncbi:MAG: Calx-beta domain-containing protein, partial [Planctomycetota bacterium]|nr:Calx-beta domain-containing protein [Planctomycetota bacterium]